MSTIPAAPQIPVPEADIPARAGYVRLAAGLVQGLFLYFLYRSHGAAMWPATEPYAFGPLLLLGALLPALFITGFGHFKTRTLALWLGVAALLVASMVLHEVWRSAHLPRHTQWNPMPLVSIFAVLFLFIAHSLVMAAAREQRRVASYATHFETAWKLMIQLVFSAFFVGALWLALGLGAHLFKLVGLRFLEQLLGQPWFVIPVVCCAFSCALHITDVRPALVKGIRTLLLVLMSWLLPVATLIVAGFLCSLPFTGLQILFATRSATAVLLGTAAMLIVLINAAYQNGEPELAVARVLRHSARVACALLLPITAIAVYALGLRVADYGWTSDRIIAAACLLVALCYAFGYLMAAYSKGPWLAQLARVNVVAAYLVLGVLLALFTPIADPARISVADQVARLDRGSVTAARFDYAYLRWEGARYGAAALLALQQRTGPDAAILREHAKAALALQHRYETPKPNAVEIGANLKPWPEGARLPATFPLRDWHLRPYSQSLPNCLRFPGHVCEVFLIDLTGDRQDELLLIGREKNSGGVAMWQVKGEWSMLGRLPYTAGGCAALIDQLKAGQFQLVQPEVNDIEVNGTRLSIERQRAPALCTDGVDAAAPPAPQAPAVSAP